jgi:hypothetical protein
MTTKLDDSRPIPCPHEGDETWCERCWASHEDATPYCTSTDYIERRGDPKRIAQYNAWAAQMNKTHFGGYEQFKLIVTRTT